jgi:TRAP-type mannitol/chloroaromatic compound transport system permease large subunit
MSTLALSCLSIAVILLLIGIRIPIGVALGGVAFVGFWYLRNVTVALSVLEDSPFVFAANWDLTAIPMFLLMGYACYHAQLTEGLFRAARVWLGGLPGGLGGLLGQ